MALGVDAHTHTYKYMHTYTRIYTDTDTDTHTHTHTHRYYTHTHRYCTHTDIHTKVITGNQVCTWHMSNLKLLMAYFKTKLELQQDTIYSAFTRSPCGRLPVGTCYIIYFLYHCEACQMPEMIKQKALQLELVLRSYGAYKLSHTFLWRSHLTTTL